MLPTRTQEGRLSLPALVTFCCGTAFVVAALGSLAWPLRLPLLATGVPGAPSMNPLTSLCVALAAVALWRSRRAGAGAAARGQAQGCAAVVTVIGAWRLWGLASGNDPGIDLLLFREQLQASIPPSRMGFYSAVSLVLMGPGLLLLDSSRAFARLCSEVLLHAVTAVALMAIVGYLYSASAIQGAMAIPTAFAMLLLGCGSILARPDRGLVRVWLSPTVGGALARRLLPTALAVPLVLGWARLEGQRMGLYGLELGTAILVLALITTQVWTVTVTARALDASEAQRRQAQEALRTSQERLSLLLDTNLIGVLSVIGNDIVDANRTFLEMIGRSREDLPLSPDAITPPEWRGLGEHGRQEIAQRGIATPFEKEYWHRSGGRVPVLVGGAAVPDTQEILAFVVDLSGKKGAELEMERMRLFLDSVIENIPNMVFVKEAKDLRFVRMNRAGEDLLGWSRRDFLGKNDHDLFPAEEADFFTSKDREVLSSGGMLDIPEEPLKTRQGEIRILHTKKVPIVDANGTPQFLLGISEDITDRKEAERQVEQLHEGLRQRTVELEAANRELEAFSYSVSHDLRAPLRHLDGFTDLLIRHAGATLDDKGRRYLDILSSSAKHMGRLIDDLLAFSRMSRTEMQETWVSLGPMVAEIRRALEGSYAGRAIEWKIVALPEVQGDPAMLRLVFTNLLANAVKYTGRRAEAVIEVGATETDSEWTLFVRDNGVGFDMTYSHKLFGVFQRLHGEKEFEGTGIGLANVRRIIHRHGGRTWAEGALDQGATFYVSLPRREAPVEERKAA